MNRVSNEVYMGIEIIGGTDRGCYDGVVVDPLFFSAVTLSTIQPV